MEERFNKDPLAAQTVRTDTPDNFLVVGIGASAGGVQAAQGFLRERACRHEDGLRGDFAPLAGS